MNEKLYIQAVFGVMVCGLLAFSGCKSEQEFKEQADVDVYSILDAKWKPEFGSKANYRVSDVAPDANDIAFDPNWAPSGMLTLADAVSIATTRNREYQDRKESLYETALSLTFQRHQFAPKWFGTFDAGYVNNENDEFVAADGQLGFTQLMAEGTEISVAIAGDWLRYLTGDSSTSLGSVLSASIRQPLLRGAGKRVVQENLTQADRNVLYQIRSFNRYRKQFVVSTVSQYFRTLQSLDRVGNAQNNYESLKLSYDRAKMRAEAGQLPPIEAAQTEQQMLTARDGLARAQRIYEQALDSYKLELGVPVDLQIELDPNVLPSLAAMKIAEPGFAVQEAVETALKTRLDLANVFDQVDDADRKVYVAADALKAQLDLVGSANVESTEKTKIDRLRFNDGTYGAGFELDLPLDRLAERNTYRRSMFDFLQAKRDYDKFVDEVKLQVRNDYRALIEAAERYRIQLISLELAQRRVDSTQMLMEAGRVQARDVLDAQDSLLEAQNDTTGTLVDYTISKLNFYRDIGLLKVKPDGLWEPLKDQDEKLF
ncbi:MAG: TolC family protein [Planctomycetota bacterium]